MEKIDFTEALLLIVDEFDGILNTEQTLKLNHWRAISDENERTYQEFHSIRRQVDELANFKQLNIDESWESLNKSLPIDNFDTNEINNLNKVKVRSFKVFWFSAAAIVLVVLGLFLLRAESTNQVIATNGNGHKRFVLPDGSFVVLNENSKIKYDSSNFIENRQVTLMEGEVYFDVMHQPDHPFTVLAKNAIVKDLGTTFYVNCNDKNVTVNVKSGQVQLISADQNRTKIINEKESYQLNLKDNTIANIPNVNSEWENKALDFKNVELNVIVNKLNKSYNSKIIIQNPELNKRLLTANLSYKTIDSALSVIATSLQVIIVKDRNSTFKISN